VRGLLTLLILLPTLVVAGDDEVGRYSGRAVVEVIDEFRDAGEPFAYSTNLVGSELVVVEEPEAGEPIEIVRQILRPHGLTVEERAGVYLVMRFDAEGLEVGSILLVITTRDDGQPLQQAAVSVLSQANTQPQIALSLLQ